MAAGRHSGYRDNEFEGRERDSEVSREVGSKKGLAYDRFRNDGSRDYKRVRGEGLENGDNNVRGRIREKDIEERDVVINGGNRYSSSSRSNSGSSGSKKCALDIRSFEREPGELSSESNSDGDDDSESRLILNGARKIENGNQSPVQSRKRKFSPIIWDREDERVLGELKNSPEASTLPPPPPLLKSLEASKLTSTLPPPPPLPKSPETSELACTLPPLPPVHMSFVASHMHLSPNKSSKVQTPYSLSENPIVEYESHLSEAAGSLSGRTSPRDWEAHCSTNDQAEDVEEEYVAGMDIGSSRWAKDAESSADEGEIYEDAMMKKKPISKSVGMGDARKAVNPEIEGLERVGSFGSRPLVGSRKAAKPALGEINEDQYHCAVSSESGIESNDELDSDGTPEAATPPQRNVNMLQGCRSVDVFERLNMINEGTYGVVYRARDPKTGETVALKKVKMEKEREGFPLTSLREMNILLSFNHPSIVDVKEVVVGSSLDRIFMVMEYMEHDLKGLMETMKQPFSQSEVKCLMLQLLEGTKYLHDNWVLHRDLKTSNILLNNRGELKICDFGLSRQYGSPLKPYTQLVVTLWYRAPELLLGAKQYSTSIDMWSLGCIMAELLSKKPLFNGKSEIEQINKIFKTLGTPNETIWPGYSKLPGVKMNFAKHPYNLLRKQFPPTSFTGAPILSDAGFDLLNKLLTYDPESRITAEAALDHRWFHEVPLPKSKEFMPTFPAQHVQDGRMRRVIKSPDPLEEQRQRELQTGGLGTGGVFG